MCGLLAACFNGGRGGWFLRVLAYSCRSARPGAHCIPALSSPLLSTRKQSTAPRTRRLSRPSSCSLANTQPVLPCWRACTHTHTHTPFFWGWRACTHTHTHTHTHTPFFWGWLACTHTHTHTHTHPSSEGKYWLPSFTFCRTRFPFLSHIIFYFSLSSLGYLGSISGATLGTEVAANLAETNPCQEIIKGIVRHGCFLWCGENTEEEM